MKLRILAGLILISLYVLVGFGAETSIQKLTASNLPSFLTTFRRDLNQIDTAFEHLSGSKLPLFDETGHPLGRRKITDRRLTLVDLRKTLKDFENRPQNLVVTMTLSDQTEELADEVYDLSQIAYDNDQEELAMQLTDLLGVLNNDANLIEAYALDLATQKEQLLQHLGKDQQSSVRSPKDMGNDEPRHAKNIPR